VKNAIGWHRFTDFRLTKIVRSTFHFSLFTLFSSPRGGRVGALITKRSGFGIVQIRFIQLGML